MNNAINKTLLAERTELNYQRFLGDPYYLIENAYNPTSGWAGDKEGRLILALISHYKISGRIAPCLTQMIEKLPSMLNTKGYLGDVNDELICEQQLAGHSWLLRGLCEYYEQFKHDYALDCAKTIVKDLFLPLSGKVATYPVERESNENGGVAGHSETTIGNWLLSTDVGCAFMCIDGLSHVYMLTQLPELKSLIDELIDFYVSIDKAALRVQTHCTLTSARGMMRMYGITKDEKYLASAKSIYELYVFGGGCTYTYHNLNWWGRPNTWTEPCAVVDSLMLASELYKATGDKQYRTFAARVYHNAFSSLQRTNGGAGTDTVVTAESPWDYLALKGYEARFCCTMRLAEGLWYINENADILYAETNGQIVKDERGVYTDGDIVYCEVEEEYRKYADSLTELDGHVLCPIIKLWRTTRVDEEKIRMQIIF